MAQGIEPSLPVAWLDQWAGSADTAFVFEGQPVSYGDFVDRVEATAASLAERGVGTGDRVTWVGLNRVELFETLLACARIGAIFNPLNNRLTVAELAALVADAEPSVIVTTDGFAASMVQAVGQTGLTAAVVDLDTEPLDTGEAAQPTTSVVQPDEPLLMVFTSGTTGQAKGAVLSHRAVAQTVANGMATQSLGPGDKVIASLPTFHVGGINIQTLPTLVAGGTVVLTRRFDPAQVLELIATERPTQSLLVPAMLTAIAALPNFAATDLSCLRGVISGSSIVPAAATAPWFARGVPIGGVYGTTETGPTVVVLEYADAAERPTVAGRIVDGAEMRIVDVHGTECVPDEPGEILLKGDNLFTEYWRNPQATADAFVDGWYRTGDVGSVDADGWLTVSDRLGDMIISGGENIYPAEVEAVLADHPAIDEIAVIGRRDERFGEVGVAVVVPTDSDAPPHLEEIREWASDKLARFKQPRELVLVETLPRTALGKVTKNTLREQI